MLLACFNSLELETLNAMAKDLSIKKSTDKSQVVESLMEKIFDLATDEEIEQKQSKKREVIRHWRQKTKILPTGWRLKQTQKNS